MKIIENYFPQYKYAIKNNDAKQISVSHSIYKLMSIDNDLRVKQDDNHSMYFYGMSDKTFWNKRHIQTPFNSVYYAENNNRRSVLMLRVYRTV